MSKTKKPGTLVKNKSGFYLQMMVNGRRFMRKVCDPKTGATATNKVQAEKWRDAIAEEIRIAATNKVADDIALDKLEAAYLDALPNYSKRTGNTHIDATKQTRIAPRTLQLNLNTLRDFIAHTKSKFPHVATTADITAVHGNSFMATKSHLKEATFNRYLMALRQICDVIPHIGKNPFHGITARPLKDVKNDTDSHARFTSEQLQSMTANAAGWIKPAMYIGFYTGLRLGDVIALKWDDLDGDYITTTARKTGKQLTIYAPEVMPHLNEWRDRVAMDYTTPGNQYVAKILGISEQSAVKLVRVGNGLPTDPTPETFTQWLQNTCRAGIRDGMTAPGVANWAKAPGPAALPITEPPATLSGYIFPRQAARYLGINRKADPTAASKQFQKFLAACGINTKNERGATVLGFHSLRVTFATLNRIHSGDTEQTRQALQHGSSRTTEGYIQRSEDEIRAELRKSHIPLLMPGDAPAQVNDPRQELHRLIDELPAEAVEELLQAAKDLLTWI